MSPISVYKSIFILSRVNYIMVYEKWTLGGVNMEKSLSANIHALRVQNGLNQATLAAKLNVTKQCVSNWENDNVQPSIEMLQKLADIFGVSTDVLLGRAPDSVLDVSGLSVDAVAHLRLLIRDLKKT